MKKIVILVLFLITVSLTACGGGGDDDYIDTIMNGATSSSSTSYWECCADSGGGIWYLEFFSDGTGVVGIDDYGDPFTWSETVNHEIHAAGTVTEGMSFTGITGSTSSGELSFTLVDDSTGTSAAHSCTLKYL